MDELYSFIANSGGCEEMRERCLVRLKELYQSEQRIEELEQSIRWARQHLEFYENANRKACECDKCGDDGSCEDHSDLLTEAHEAVGSAKHCLDRALRRSEWWQYMKFVVEIHSVLDAHLRELEQRTRSMN